MDNRPIGIFDSGVGGLTVFKKLIDVIPFEDIIYFGDTARFPYGSKSKDLVLTYSTQIINFFKTLDVKAVVIACNTVSSSCYEDLQNSFDFPIIDIISPAVEEVFSCTKNLKVGVLATETTVKSLKYETSIKLYNPLANVFSVACPEFALLAESGNINSSYTTNIVKKYVTPLLEKNVDTIILGCTHYPFLLNVIRSVIPSNVSIVNPAKNLAHKTKNILFEKNLLGKSRKNANYRFFTSQNSQTFNEMSYYILNKKYDVTNINIEKF